MRTNIVIDDHLIEHAMALTGIRTKKAVVEEALKTLIRLQDQKGMRAQRGKLPWEGDLNAMREGRFGSIG